MTTHDLNLASEFGPLGENEGSSLWLRQIGTASDVRLLAPVRAEIWGLTFSPDGRFIYYNLFGGEKIDFELYRVPSLGGAIERIPNVSTRAVAFSPDGAKHPLAAEIIAATEIAGAKSEA